MAREFTVIYRTGGTENFQWHKVATVFTSRLLACDKADELIKMGYPAIIHDADRLSSIGLPETFAA